jgi:peptide/nickel transport system ATP-binding protein
VYPVLRNVTLAIGRGERLGIVGESGCGKSTLALALLGFLRPGSRLIDGVVQYGALDLFRLAPAELQRLRGGRIALVPQNAGQSLTPSLPLGAQVAESLTLHRGLSPAAARAQAIELLAQVGLPDAAVLARRYPHEMSGGQQQRVAIAMALAGEPELLVLDEPTTGLDVTTQAHVLDLLAEIGERRKAAMVYVSHDLGVIARASVRLAIMYAGEIVEAGPTADVFARPHHPYTRGLLASVPRLHTAALPEALPGHPPTPGSYGTGCAFAPRCAFVSDLCRNSSPALAEISADHAVRCHHWPAIAAAATIALQPRARARSVTETTAALDLDAVSISYQRRGVQALIARARGDTSPPTVSAVSLSLRPGTTLALVGESGSGKSTIARAIAGLQPIVQGSIRLGDVDLALPVQRRSIAVRRSVQLIFQNPDASLNPRHTVSEILGRPQQLFFGLSSGERRARSIALLEQMRLGPHYLDRFPGQLSGGEKQRVAIARAFAAEPDLVLCDEVVSALDVSVQAAVLQLLAELQADRGVSYLFISHDLAVVRAIADEVAVLYQGRICEIGKVAEVYAPPFHPYTASLLAAAPEPIPERHLRVRDRDSLSAAPPARGCPFYQRCPHRIEPTCAVDEPPWREFAQGHAIRCHLSFEKTDEVGIALASYTGQRDSHAPAS